MKKMLSVLLVLVMLLSVTAAQATSYKASKVTAKQIVTQLKKTGLIKKVSKAGSDATEYMKFPNAYKSKYNFTDKKYKNVYCTVEVFRDNYDAARRQAYIDILDHFYGTFEIKEDIPLQAYRYKNVVLRVGSKMPLSRVMKYYNALKKTVK